MTTESSDDRVLSSVVNPVMGGGGHMSTAGLTMTERTAAPAQWVGLKKLQGITLSSGGSDPQGWICGAGSRCRWVSDSGSLWIEEAHRVTRASMMAERISALCI